MAPDELVVLLICALAVTRAVKELVVVLLHAAQQSSQDGSSNGFFLYLLQWMPFVAVVAAEVMSQLWGLTFSSEATKYLAFNLS
jgi:hypothetical protein